MKRLSLFGSWKRLGVQAGLLAGLGLAFVGTSEKPAQAGGQCPDEGQCTFKKPNLMIVLDYSSSMHAEFEPGVSRWDAAKEAVQNLMTTNNGYFNERVHFALLRFGHDPDPDNDGTIIVTNGQQDTSGIVDGQSLDVGWYDPNVNPPEYYQCNGQDIVDFLDDVPDPLCVGLNCAGIGTWTWGALDEARTIINQTRAAFPDDVTPDEERYYGILLLTDGLWSTVYGLEPDDPDTSPDNPVPVAADLFNNMDVPTYVVAFGEAAGEAFADDIAVAGGTGQAIEAGAGQLIPALESVLDDIQNSVIIPECTGGLPRIMVVLDASSSMLNVDGVAGAMGETGWDQARAALAGMNSIFDVEVGGLQQPVEDLVHLGLISFGSAGEQQILVNYGPCMKDNFDWALDPNTSCDGCGDPWGGPPITWTFVGPGDAAYPGFDAATYSRMPACQPSAQQPGACTGSATAIHTGLQLADSNAQDYRDNPPALYPANATTQFANIVITDGSYANWSNDAQVSQALIDMYANDDITSYVIGFGSDIAPAQLDNMACWGSGGTGTPCNGGTVDAFDAGTQADLEAALSTIIEGINFDPCCNFNDCSFNPEPTTGEPDPVPPETSGSSGGDTMGLTSGGSGTDSDPTATDTGVDTTGGGSASATDTNGPTSGDPTDTNSGSGSDSDSDTNNPTTATVTDTASTAGDTEGDTDGGGAADDDGGCGCTTDSSPRGWTGLLALGLLGLVRRRRRVA